MFKYFAKIFLKRVSRKSQEASQRLLRTINYSLTISATATIASSTGINTAIIIIAIYLKYIQMSKYFICYPSIKTIYTFTARHTTFIAIITSLIIRVFDGKWMDTATILSPIFQIYSSQRTRNTIGSNCFALPHTYPQISDQETHTKGYDYFRLSEIQLSIPSET